MFRQTQNQIFLTRAINVNYKKDILKKNNLTFTQKRFQSNFNNPLSMLPPTVRGIIMANTAIYLLSFTMSKRDFILNFFYNSSALQHGKAYTLLTTHFAKNNFFDYIIETLFTGLMGTQLELMMGTPMFRRLIFGAVGIGTLILLLLHSNDSAFIKSESIFRAVIMFMVLQNPQQSFMLIPFPIKIKALWIGVIICGLDFFTQRWVNFGGTIAAYMMLRGKF